MALFNPLIRKLEQFATLSDEEKDVIERATSNVRAIPAKADIVLEGSKPENTHLVLSGFACRYKMSAEGARQITTYLLPGDFCDLRALVLPTMDHTIATLSRCEIADIPRHQVVEMLARPAIARALTFVALINEAVARQWIFNLGCLSGEERIAHLFCELLLRLRSVGLANGDRFELPLSQAEIADTVGLSTVHVNRMLQELRAKKIIKLANRTVTIRDPLKLKLMSKFSSDYLHLDNDWEPEALVSSNRSPRDVSERQQQG